MVNLQRGNIKRNVCQTNMWSSLFDIAHWNYTPNDKVIQMVVNISHVKIGRFQFKSKANWYFSLTGHTWRPRQAPFIMIPFTIRAMGFHHKRFYKQMHCKQDFYWVFLNTCRFSNDWITQDLYGFKRGFILLHSVWWPPITNIWLNGLVLRCTNDHGLQLR